MKARNNEIDIFNHFMKIAIYCRSENIFKWKFGKYRNKRCGRIHNSGYWIIRFTMNGKKTHIYEHRIIWWINYADFHKESENSIKNYDLLLIFNECQIDHINGIKIDNNISNLRIVSPRFNSCNQSIHRNGHLPFTSKVGKKWRAQASHNGIHLHFGYFKTQKEAHEIAKNALMKLGLIQY